MEPAPQNVSRAEFLGKVKNRAHLGEVVNVWFTSGMKICEYVSSTVREDGFAYFTAEDRLYKIKAVPYLHRQKPVEVERLPA